MLISATSSELVLLQRDLAWLASSSSLMLLNQVNSFVLHKNKNKPRKESRDMMMVVSLEFCDPFSSTRWLAWLVFGC